MPQVTPRSQSLFTTFSHLASSLRLRLKRWTGSSTLALKHSHAFIEHLEPRIQLTAAAPLPLDIEFQVNTYTTNRQEYAALTPLAAGGFVAVWASNNQNVGEDIYGQLYDSNQNKIGSEFLVNANAAFHQGKPSVTTLSNGNFVVVWNGNNAESQEDIYGRIFQADGTPVTVDFAINTITDITQLLPDVAALPGGGFAVTWTSFHNGNDSEVRARQFDNAGAPLTPEFPVNTSTAEDQRNSKIAPLSNGGYVITWYDVVDYSGAGFGVSAQIFDSASAKVGSEILVSSGSPREDSHPAVASLPDSNFIIVWDSNADIYAQIYTLSGTPVGPEFLVNQNTFDNQFVPSIAADSTSFFITWTDFGSTSGDVLGRRFLTDLSDSSDEFTVNTYTTWRQGSSASTILSSGAAIVLWESVIQDGDILGIYGQAFSALDITPPTASPLTQPPSPTSTAIDYITVDFSEAIDVSSFNWQSVTLTPDGGANLITDTTGVTFDLLVFNSTTYVISGLSPLITTFGKYVLTLVDGGVSDPTGNKLDGAVSTDWIVTASVPSPPSLDIASTVSPGVANIPTPRFTGVGAPNAGIEFWVDGFFSSTGTIDNTGSYGFEIAALSQGNHSIKARTKVTIGGTDYYSDYTPDTSFAVNTGKFTSITSFPGTRTTPVTSVIVNVNTPVDPTSFTWHDITLTRNGSGVNVSTVTVALAGPGYAPNALKITLPADVTTTPGNYILTVGGASILSTVPQPLLNDISTTWTTEARLTSISQIPTPHSTAVTTIIVNPTQAVQLLSLSSSDITLTRNSSPIPLFDATFELAGTGYAPNAIKITLPASATSAFGDYQFTVNGSGIDVASAFGVSFSNSVSANWTYAPVFNGFSGGYTPIRTSPLTSIILNASTPIDLASLSGADFTLTVEGVLQDTSGFTFALAGAGYAVNAVKITLPAGATTPIGSYVLTVVGSDVISAAGPAFANDKTATWINQPLLSWISQFTSPRSAPVLWVSVNPNTPIDLNTFTVADITLNRNGIPQDLSAAGVTFALAGAGYAPNAVRIFLPAGLTSTPGNYELIVNGTSIATPYGTPFGNSPTSSWTFTPTFNAFTGYTPTRSSPQSSIVMNVNGAVDLDSLSGADFTVTLDGIPLDTSGFTFALAGAGYAANAVMITLPTALTTPIGNYVLTVTGANILSVAGPAFVDTRSATWTNEPRLASITQFTPRTTPVLSVSLNPSQPIDLATFTLADITLNLGGIAQDLSGAGVTIVLAGPGYAANAVRILLPAGLTSTNGTYELIINGTGIQTTYGPAFINSVASTWTKS